MIGRPRDVIGSLALFLGHAKAQRNSFGNTGRLARDKAARNCNIRESGAARACVVGRFRISLSLSLSLREKERDFD